MILVVDIGNTSVSLGIYLHGRVLRSTSFHAKPGLIGESLREFVSTDHIDGVSIASVVPAGNGDWRAAVHDGFGMDPFFVDCHCSIGVEIDYPRPEKIGADRLANACAAHRFFGAPVVVADFGTALTFDIVSAESAYVGGVIAPGLPLMFDYLAERTALLPHLEIAPVERFIGKSTEEAMRIGAHSGYPGMVRAILDDIASELGRFTLCATGGYAKWVLENWDGGVDIVSDLTLIGVGDIYNLNHSGTCVGKQ